MSTQEQQSPRKRPVLRAAGVIVGVVAIAVVAYIAVMHSSVADVRTRAEALQHDVEELSSAIDQVDAEAAANAARSIADSASALAASLDGWQWDVAAHLPHYGVDVEAGRQLADVANSLAQRVLLPAVSVADGYSASVSSEGIFAIFDADLLADAGEALIEAVSAVREASAALDAIPTANIVEINEAAAELREPIDKIVDVLDTYDSVANRLNLEGILPSA